jgi:hypothetical protein
MDKSYILNEFGNKLKELRKKKIITRTISRKS